MVALGRSDPGAVVQKSSARQFADAGGMRQLRLRRPSEAAGATSTGAGHPGARRYDHRLRHAGCDRQRTTVQWDLHALGRAGRCEQRRRIFAGG